VAVGIRGARWRRREGLGLESWGEVDEAHVGQRALDLIGDLLGDVGVDEAQAGGGGLEAVLEGLAGEVVVDEGGLGADAPQSPPQKDEGVGVLEVDGDNVARLDAKLLFEKGTVAEDAVVDVCVGEVATLEDDEILLGG